MTEQQSTLPASSEVRYIPLELLYEPHFNYNKHDAKQVYELAESLRAFGQRKTIAVWPDEAGKFEVLAGNGIVFAAREAKLAGLNCTLAPKEWSVELRKAYLVADNNKNSNPDLLKLADLVDEARRLGTVSLEAMGYNEDTFNQLMTEASDFFLDNFDDTKDEDDESEDESEELDTENDESEAKNNVFSHEQIVENAFNYFRETGFPYRKLALHVCMQEINKLANTPLEKLVRTDTAYHVADTYHPHRFHASAEGMKSPFDAFNEDKLLMRALRLQVEQAGTIPAGMFGVLNVVSGTQSCSNFRPGFASYLYRTYCKEGYTVLDTSTGYGGRLVGFIASNLKGKYIGIDPNVPTYEANLRMARDLGFSDSVELINAPAEDVDPETLRARCDFAFTSPPYFAKEHYSDDSTQSWVRYRTGEEWRDGFLRRMLALQFAALKHNRYAIVNIADVKLRNKVYPLVDWTIELGKEVGFTFVKQDKFEMTTRFGANTGDEVAFEPVLVFHKK